MNRLPTIEQAATSARDLGAATRWTKAREATFVAVIAKLTVSARCDRLAGDTDSRGA